MYRIVLTVAAFAWSAFPAFGQTPAPKKAAPASQKAKPAAQPAKTKPQPAAAPKADPAPPAAAAQAPAPPSDRVVLKVGGEQLTAAQIEAFLETLPPQTRMAARGPNRRAFIEQFASMKALAQEARKQKLDQKPEFRKMLELQEENLLAMSMYQSMNETVTVDEAETRKYYDEHKSEYESAKASHILIRTKGSAVPLRDGQKDLSDEEALEKTRAIKKRIAAGEDFAAVAKAESDDTGSGAQGGSLGVVRRGQTVPPFENAVFTAAVKQLSDPIKTQFGYHLIVVDERTSQPYDTVRNEIQQKMRPELARKRLDEIKKGAEITIDDSYFGPAQPPTPQAPPPDAK